MPQVLKSFTDFHPVYFNLNTQYEHLNTIRSPFYDVWYYDKLSFYDS